MSCILGIDLGTSYFKAALFDRSGVLLGLGRLPVPKQTHNGHCELSVEDFWFTIRQCVALACAEARVAPAEIAAVGYASQANSFLLLDSQGQPLTPLILWPDLRAAEEPSHASELWQAPDFLNVTGLGLESPEFMPYKLAWFQRHEPALWAKTRRVMTISDYFVFGLTRHCAGDAGTASLLGLWELRQQRWWDKALSSLDLPREFLSDPLPPGTLAGDITADSSRLFGFGSRVPLVVGSLDHHMAAIGAGLGSVAPATDSTGTVIALLRNASEWNPRPGCCMGPAAGGAGYYQLAFSNRGAGTLEEYQRDHAPELSLTDLLAHAEDETPPHGPKVRAILEELTGEVAALVRQLYAGEVPDRIVATGGGARSDIWLQLKANRIGSEFVATKCQEPACMGAALLAAVGIGWFGDLEAASRAWIHPHKVFSPRQQRGQPAPLRASFVSPALNN